jgi:type II secretory pathway pseudopilin PulG
MRLRPAARRPGITLLEVLGATAIFLTSIVAIGELMSSSTDQALDVQFRSRATRLCQSKLNEFAAGVEQLSGATEGDFEEEEGWSWKAEVTPDGSAANLYKVQVTVTHDSARGPVEVTMAQFVFDPLQRGQLTASTTTDASGSGSGTGSGTSGTGSGAAAGSGSSGTGAGAGSGGRGGGTGGGGGAGGGGTGGGGRGGGGTGGVGTGGGGTGGGGRGGGGTGGGGRGGP